jgi:hypothetical protein
MTSVEDTTAGGPQLLGGRRRMPLRFPQTPGQYPSS